MVNPCTVMTAIKSQHLNDCHLHNTVTLCRVFPSWPIKYGCMSHNVNTGLRENCQLWNEPSPMIIYTV